MQITTVPGSGFTNNRVVAAQSLAEFRLTTARSARVALYARIPQYLDAALSQVFEVSLGHLPPGLLPPDFCQPRTSATRMFTTWTFATLGHLPT